RGARRTTCPAAGPAPRRVPRSTEGRYDAELLEDGERVLLDPVLGDPAVGEAEEAHPVDLEPRACRRDPEHFLGVRPACVPAGRDPIAVAGDVVDRQREVWHACAEHA